VEELQDMVDVIAEECGMSEPSALCRVVQALSEAEEEGAQ